MPKTVILNKQNKTKVSSIPVIIDSSKNYVNFKMTRCSYFTIECDTPIPDWTLIAYNKKIPFYMLGLSAIIYKPLGNKKIFSKLQQLKDIFEIVENNTDLFIDSNHIWIPNFLFNSDFKRGYVFRLDKELFTIAYKFSAGKISQRTYLKYCKKLERKARFSKIETKIFRQWQKELIDEAIKIYHKYPKKALKYKI